MLAYDLSSRPVLYIVYTTTLPCFSILVRIAESCAVTSRLKFSYDLAKTGYGVVFLYISFVYHSSLQSSLFPLFLAFKISSCRTVCSAASGLSVTYLCRLSIPQCLHGLKSICIICPHIRFGCKGRYTVNNFIVILLEFVALMTFPQFRLDFKILLTRQ